MAMSVGSPGLLVIAFVAAVACLFLGRRRWHAAICLAVAVLTALSSAADVQIRMGAAPLVAVLIDASESTRGMWYRDREATRLVAQRLAPDAKLDVSTFDGTTASLPTRDSSDAMLLFSDGQFDFDVDLGRPIFPVVDVEQPTGDAKLSGIEQSDDRVVVLSLNDGPPRTLTWPDGTTTNVPTGTVRLSHAASAGIARLNSADRWPENDSITFTPAVQVASERWWIGESPAPAGYRSIDPRALPPSDAWLAACQVVLDNVSADELGTNALRSLSRYVRDLGGGLTIVGGDRAFSAGGYGGTELDAISPLTSRAPEPQHEWLMLIDASGSMAKADEDGRTRLGAAIDAADGAVRALPEQDAVSIATFAREFRPWPPLANRRVIAPSDLVASGPTNLRAALEAIIATRQSDSAGTLSLRVIALTDGDADVGDAEPIGAALRAAGIVLDWLRLDEAAAANQFAEIVRATGGSIVSAGSTRDWRSRAVTGARAAERVSAAATPTVVRWMAGPAGESMAKAANLVWPRGDPEVLATRVADDSPIAARWRVGAGRVIAIAYAASPTTTEQMADSITSSPRDPRFAVQWDGETVRVEAAKDGAAMKDLKIDLFDVDSASTLPVRSLAQDAPGRYIAALAAERRPRTIAMRVNGQTIDLHALAGGIDREFRHIGVDREALERLAARTGGRVIDRSALHNPSIITVRRPYPLAVPLLLVAALSTASAIVVGRR